MCCDARDLLWVALKRDLTEMLAIFVSCEGNNGGCARARLLGLRLTNFHLVVVVKKIIVCERSLRQGNNINTESRKATKIIFNSLPCQSIESKESSYNFFIHLF